MIRSLLIFVLSISFMTVSFSGISMAQGPPEIGGPPETQFQADCIYDCAVKLASCISEGGDNVLCVNGHDECIDLCLEIGGGPKPGS